MNHFTMNAGFISINLTIRSIFGCSILDYHHYCLLKALDEDFVYLCFEIQDKYQKRLNREQAKMRNNQM